MKLVKVSNFLISSFYDSKIGSLELPFPMTMETMNSANHPR